VTEAAIQTLPTPPTSDEILEFINYAKHEYQHAKTGAMKSAAGAYLVWHFGESANAEIEMRTWLGAEVDKRNANIDAHNTIIENRRRKAKEFANGSMNETHSVEYKAKLTADAALLVADWAALKQVKIDARHGASNFTRIVKFVFEFKKPSDATHTSRYAKVLEYIEKHKNRLAGNFTIDAIVQLLDDVGGFEAAVEAMRGNAPAESDAVRASKLAKIKSAVNLANTGQIEFHAKYQTGGYVFMIGRANGGQTTVCGELKLSDNEAEELMLKVDADVMGNNDPVADFIARAVSLGELVRDGYESNVTIENANAAKKHKVTRAYSLVALGESTQLVVSARYTDVSAVIHAMPKPHINIGKVTEGRFVTLAIENGAEFTKPFTDAGYRALLTVKAQQGGSDAPVLWHIETALERKTETQQLAWKSLYTDPNRPVDTHDYTADCTINLSHADLRHLYDTYLSGWVKNKKNNQNVAKLLTVSFDGITLMVGHDAHGQYKRKVGDKQGAAVSVIMRPRDVVDLCSKLIELNVNCCAISGDTNRMLAASWQDEFGDYIVHLPAAEDRGGLIKGCVRNMKPPK
jgi:hypothetical protein